MILILKPVFLGLCSSFKSLIKSVGKKVKTKKGREIEEMRKLAEIVKKGWIAKKIPFVAFASKSLHLVSIAKVKKRRARNF
jgi:hypothetical protein